MRALASKPLVTSRGFLTSVNAIARRTHCTRFGHFLFDQASTQWHRVRVKHRLELKPQEPPLDDPDSSNRFQPRPDKPFLATPGVIERYGHETIVACLRVLQQRASEHNGIDYLQVFESADGDRLWFIEDGEGGAITALLPEEY